MVEKERQMRRIIADILLWLYIIDVPEPSLEDTPVSFRELQLVVVCNVADRPQWAQSKVRTSEGKENRYVCLVSGYVPLYRSLQLVHLLAVLHRRRLGLFLWIFSPNIPLTQKIRNTVLRYNILLLSVLNMSTHFSSRKYIWTNNPLQCRESNSLVSPSTLGTIQPEGEPSELVARQRAEFKLCESSKINPSRSWDCRSGWDNPPGRLDKRLISHV